MIYLAVAAIMIIAVLNDAALTRYPWWARWQSIKKEMRRGK